MKTIKEKMLEANKARTDLLSDNPEINSKWTPDAVGIMEAKKVACSCGRSPVGRCVGWHKLSDKRWIETLAEYQKMTPEQREGFLSPKAIDGLGE